jgi:hypothetical protein
LTLADTVSLLLGTLGISVSDNLILSENMIQKLGGISLSISDLLVLAENISSIMIGGKGQDSFRPVYRVRRR